MSQWKAWVEVMRHIRIDHRGGPVFASHLEDEARPVFGKKASTLRARVRELCPDRLVEPRTGARKLSKVTARAIVPNEFLTKINRNTDDMGWTCSAAVVGSRLSAAGSTAEAGSGGAVSSRRVRKRMILSFKR